MYPATFTLSPACVIGLLCVGGGGRRPQPAHHLNGISVAPGQEVPLLQLYVPQAHAHGCSRHVLGESIPVSLQSP